MWLLTLPDVDPVVHDFKRADFVVELERFLKEIGDGEGFARHAGDNLRRENIHAGIDELGKRGLLHEAGDTAVRDIEAAKGNLV